MIYTFCTSIDRNALKLHIDSSTTRCIDQKATSPEELQDFVLPLVEALYATMKKAA